MILYSAQNILPINNVNGVNEKNVSQLEVCTGPQWTPLKGEIVDINAIYVWCSICCKPAKRLHCFHNSEAFVTGISGSAMKKRCFDKAHGKSSSYSH